MPKETQILTLRAAEAYSDDWGRGLVRIVFPLMQEFGLTAGDVVELSSVRSPAKKVGATLIPGKKIDHGIGIVRVDRYKRKNIGISLGGLVNIKRVRRQEATQFTVAPAEDKVKLLVKPESLKKRMINHALNEGEELPITGKIRMIPPPTITSETPLLKMVLMKVALAHSSKKTHERQLDALFSMSI